MNNYDIKINVPSLLHYSVLSKSKVDNETLLMLINSFSWYVRKTYVSMIYESIYSSRYKGDWEPIYDQGYLDYIGTNPSADIFDLIYDALEIRSIKQNIVIRIDPDYMYPNSKLKLLTVLNAIDNGTTKFNARPLLKGVARKLRFKLHSLWRVYLRQRGVA